MKKFIVALLVVAPFAALGCGGDNKVVAPTVVPEKPGSTPSAGGSGAASGGAGSTTSASATN